MDVGDKVIFTNAFGTAWCGTSGVVIQRDGGYYYVRPSRQRYEIECHATDVIPFSDLPIKVRYSGDRRHIIVNKPSEMRKGVPFTLIARKV